MATNQDGIDQTLLVKFRAPESRAQGHHMTSRTRVLAPQQNTYATGWNRGCAISRSSPKAGAGFQTGTLSVHAHTQNLYTTAYEGSREGAFKGDKAQPDSESGCACIIYRWSREYLGLEGQAGSRLSFWDVLQAGAPQDIRRPVVS